MDSYEIRWKSSATRDLHNIDSQQIPRIIEAVESLANNPFPPQHRKMREMLDKMDLNFSVMIHLPWLQAILLNFRCLWAK